MHDHPPTPRQEQEPNYEVEPTPRPAIYVASLADYNNGHLHGTWLDAARNPDAIRADVDAMLTTSHQPDAEEFAIHDYEQFGSWRVDEFASIDRVSHIARGIAEYGYAYAAWASILDTDPELLDSNRFQEAYLGHHDSVTAFAEQEAEAFGYDDSLGILPEALRRYLHFDTAAFARDLELSGDITSVEDPSGGVWVFRTTE